MKILRYSSQAKKDLKRYRNNLKKMQNLYEVLDMLVNDIPLPEKYKVHKLIGNYQGCFECHVENDFLLIWIDEENNAITILRLGSHSELF